MMPAPRKTRRKLLALIVAVVPAVAWTEASARRPQLQVASGSSAPAKDTAAAVKSSNAFAWALYRRLADEQKGNLFFSPASIHAALTMTSAGAAGRTAEQMQQTLHLPLDDVPEKRLHKAYRALLETMAPGEDAGYQLHIANALWGQEGYRFLDDFLALNRQCYGAGLRRVDFKTATEPARRTINAWVEKQTRDKIKELLQRGILKPTTRLVLTNAIYFKGDWASQFDEKRTRPMPFHPASGKPVKVPTMFQQHKFGYTEAPGFQMLQMPYKGDALSMVILLPRKKDGLAEVVASLKGNRLDAALGRIGRRKVKVLVYLPKFKLTSQFRLDKTLRSMGMEDAFTMSADFSRMNGRKDLYIQAVVHKAFVDVNEEGTEAAAATAVVVGLKSAMPRRILFKADHPFLFLIRHNKTGAILFLGRVMNPKA